MKRVWICLLVAIFVGSLTFMGIGCKEEVAEEAASAEEAAEEAAPAEEEIAKEPVKLVLWWWGEVETPGLENFIVDSIDAYEKINPNVEIEQVLQTTENTIPAFKAAAEAQGGPDIATIWYGVYQLEEVWAGNVEPIDNYIGPEETDHWLGKELSTYDGKLWGSDLYGYGSTMMYNKEAFEKADLDPETPPVTWDEFIAACEALKAAGIEPWIAGFKTPAWGFSYFASNYWPQKLDSTNELKVAAIGEEKSFTEEEFVDMWQRIDQLNKNGYYMEGGASVTYTEATQEWRMGNGAFVITASQQALMWYDELGSEKAGFMAFPSITDKKVDWMPVAPITLFITKWSPNKEIAADFLKFLHTEDRLDAMIKLLEGTCVPPDDRLDMSLVTDPQKEFLFEQVIGGFERGTWFTDALLPYMILGDGVLSAGQKLVTGEIGPEEAGQMVESAAELWRETSPEAVEKYKKWATE